MDVLLTGQVYKGGRRGGYSHLLASTLSLRAAEQATVLSHKCDIPSLLKDDQMARDNRLPVLVVKNPGPLLLWEIHLNFPLISINSH